MSPFAAIDYFPTVDDSSSSVSASTITTCSSQPLHHATTAEQEDDDCSSVSSRRRSVSFDDCIEIHFVLHHKNLTLEEKSNSWYNGDEIKTIKNGVRNDVQILTNTPNAPDTDDYTSRGIEGRTKVGAKEKKQCKIDARAAVFFEQSCQQEEEFGYDDEQIADCYYDYSEPASIKAHMIAIRDEQIAKTIYQECSKTIRDSFVTAPAIIEDPVQSPVVASSAA